MKNKLFTTELSRLLLEQAKLYKPGEPEMDDPKVPARIGDILKSRKYYQFKKKQWEKYGR